MELKIFDKTEDKVISSIFVLGLTDFNFAINTLVPMIDKYQQQRYILKSKLYDKLETDLIKGCVMPPLTIALIHKNLDLIKDYNNNQLKDLILSSIDKGFILDGIQRLSTIKRISDKKIALDVPIYLNILLCDSMDKLLYRMITLNNGQRPMSARHQIEILADSIYDFESLNLRIISEKDQKKQTLKEDKELTFTKENIIKAYMAFISNSINFDNEKIISEKLDELITNKIMEAEIPERTISFNNFIDLVIEKSKNISAFKWFSVINNMIGFSSAIINSYNAINNTNCEDFALSLKTFEEAFNNFDKSKIKIGTYRRKAAKIFTENYAKYKDLNSTDLMNEISMSI